MLYRTNGFLDKMNEGVFRPRGLYCLIMTYDPTSNDDFQEVNVASAVASRALPSAAHFGMKGKFRLASGATHSESELPEAAPLVFPALDELASKDKGKSGMKAAFSRKSNFLANYVDKRATASWVSS